LNGGRPEVLTLKIFWPAFIDFREEVVTRRTAPSAQGARRAHVQVGCHRGSPTLDEFIRLIRTSARPGTARAA